MHLTLSDFDIFFREEYGEDTTAFLFVSDDMEWAKNNEILREEKNLFFEGISFMNHPLRSDLAC